MRFHQIKGIQVLRFLQCLHFSSTEMKLNLVLLAQVSNL